MSGTFLGLPLFRRVDSRFNFLAVFVIQRELKGSDPFFANILIFDAVRADFGPDTIASHTGRSPVAAAAHRGIVIIPAPPGAVNPNSARRRTENR